MPLLLLLLLRSVCVCVCVRCGNKKIGEAEENKEAKKTSASHTGWGGGGWAAAAAGAAAAAAGGGAGVVVAGEDAGAVAGAAVLLGVSPSPSVFFFFITFFITFFFPPGFFALAGALPSSPPPTGAGVGFAAVGPVGLGGATFVVGPVGLGGGTFFAGAFMLMGACTLPFGANSRNSSDMALIPCSWGFLVRSRGSPIGLPFSVFRSWWRHSRMLGSRGVGRLLGSFGSKGIPLSMSRRRCSWDSSPSTEKLPTVQSMMPPSSASCERTRSKVSLPVIFRNIGGEGKKHTHECEGGGGGKGESRLPFQGDGSPLLGTLVLTQPAVVGASG